MHEVVGKGKAVVTEEQVAHSLIDLSKKKRTTDQFILVRRDQTSHDSTTGPSSQPEDDTSERTDDDDEEGPSLDQTQGRLTKKEDPIRRFWTAQPPPKDEDQILKKQEVLSLLMHRSDPESEHSEQSSDDIPMQDEGNDSDMEDTDNAHIPKVSTTTWFSRIQKERPATPEPEWTIPPNDFPEPENNWANTYATAYKVPEENKLQRKTYDIGSFIKWFCRRTGKKKLCKADLEGPAFNLMDECHKLLTNKVDLSNPEGHQILRNIYEPLPLGGPPGQVTIQPQFFFNKDLDYLLTGDKERMKLPYPISKLKSARYSLDFGLEELVPSLWVESEREYDISAVYGITHWWFRRKEFYINKHSESSDREAVRSQMRILSVISVKLGIESYQTKINLERPNWDAADYYFKEDYTIVPKPRAVVYRDRNDQRKLMRLNELSPSLADGTLTREVVSEMNKKEEAKPSSQRLEKNYRSEGSFECLESFVGGRIRDIDYRLINRTT
ncbi:hypothetical protein Tco_0434332 [Tanacetum coccineum]